MCCWRVGWGQFVGVVVVVRFHEHLRSRLVPIDRVCQAPGNPNNGDVDSIMESMRVNGVYAGVMAQASTGHILAGNHRYAALLGLGAGEIPVDWLDVSDEAAKRIMLVDNRTTRLGRDNESELLALLRELQETEAGLAGTGFTEEDMGFIQEEATGGFGAPEPASEVLALQVVVDCVSEDEAESAMAALSGFENARVVYL